MLGLTEQYSSRAISGHVIKGNHLPCDAGPEPTATRTAAAAVANSAVALGQSCSAMIVPARLHPNLHLQRDQERARAEHEPAADLTQRRNANAVSGDELVEPYQPHAPSWYEPEPCEERRAPHARHGAERGAKVGAVQERYECEDQERIDRPDLGGEPFHTQEPSVQLLCLPVEAISDHQRPSEAIRSHQRPSEAIRGHQRPSEAIRSTPSRSHACDEGGHQRPSGAIRDAHLQHPRRATLVIQAPIHREEAKQADQLAQRAGTLGATSAAQEAARIRGHVRVPDEGGHQRSSGSGSHSGARACTYGGGMAISMPSEVIRGHQRSVLVTAAPEGERCESHGDACVWARAPW